jgi:hypothetical protein
MAWIRGKCREGQKFIQGFSEVSRKQCTWKKPSINNRVILKCINVKFILEQATKAQRGSGGIAPPFP